MYEFIKTVAAAVLGIMIVGLANGIVTNAKGGSDRVDMSFTLGKTVAHKVSIAANRIVRRVKLLWVRRTDGSYYSHERPGQG